jgi:hypothetical protein
MAHGHCHPAQLGFVNELENLHIKHAELPDMTLYDLVVVRYI